MKDKILEKATDLFLSLGFKSVTMDDIAQKMGVSKKTIYKYFTNKTALIDSATKYMFDKICSGIEIIHEKDGNAIHELFEIKEFISLHLKNEKSSPQYQLQKYYPKIYNWLKQQQYNAMIDSVKENLVSGIEQGLYRKDIPVDFTARIYINGMNGVRDADIFPASQFEVIKLMDEFLEYHIRAIATEKGIQELESQLKLEINK